MTLKSRKHKDGSTSEILTECPIKDCDTIFGEASGAARRKHYLKEHAPEDFGL